MNKKIGLAMVLGLAFVDGEGVSADHNPSAVRGVGQVGLHQGVVAEDVPEAPGIEPYSHIPENNLDDPDENIRRWEALLEQAAETLLRHEPTVQKMRRTLSRMQQRDPSKDGIVEAEELEVQKATYRLHVARVARFAERKQKSQTKLVKLKADLAQARKVLSETIEKIRNEARSSEKSLLESNPDTAIKSIAD